LIKEEQLRQDLKSNTKPDLQRPGGKTSLTIFRANPYSMSMDLKKVKQMNEP
jgi:hypothetical protein